MRRINRWYRFACGSLLTSCVLQLSGGTCFMAKSYMPSGLYAAHMTLPIYTYFAASHFGTHALVIIFSHLGVNKFQEFCNGSSFACLVIHCALQCYIATKVWSIEKMVSHHHPIATSRGLQREMLLTQATHHSEQLLCY